MNDNNISVNKIALTVGLISLLVYLRALSCQFVNWDDTDYVLNNELIRSLDSNFLRLIFTTLPFDFYIPITWISFAIDYFFWGLNPFGYHLTNILIHAVNGGLVVYLANRLLQGASSVQEFVPRKRSLYAATLLLSGLFFALHPLRVESVAWVTERKDVLNGFFTLSSIICYLRYVRGWDDGEGRTAIYRGYIPAFILFLMSLMSKPTSIVLPFMLLVLDWYPLARLQKSRLQSVLLEKLPFVIFSLAIIPASIVWYAKEETFHSLSYFPLFVRIVVSGNALFKYFALMLFPIHLLPFYNLPMAIPKVYILETVVVLMVLVCSVYWGRKRPWIIAALISFILPIIPVLPFLGNGASLALAARYTYLPSILPGILVALLITNYYSRAKTAVGRRVAAASVIVLLLFYAGMTQNMISVWINSGTMWSRVIEYEPFDRAYFYRALYYTDSGSYASAVEDYTSCIIIATSQQLSEIYNLYAFRGEALILAERYEEAVEDFSAAISLFPHKLYYYHRAIALNKMGKQRDAEQDSLLAGRAAGKMHWFPKGSAVN